MLSKYSQNVIHENVYAETGELGMSEIDAQSNGQRAALCCIVCPKTELASP
jgi:hypothetical protein